jgi:hypothetical protein
MPSCESSAGGWPRVLEFRVRVRMNSPTSSRNIGAQMVREGGEGGGRRHEPMDLRRGIDAIFKDIEKPEGLPVKPTIERLYILQIARRSRPAALVARWNTHSENVHKIAEKACVPPHVQVVDLSEGLPPAPGHHTSQAAR